MENDDSVMLDGSHEAHKGLSHMLGTLPTKGGGSAKMLAKSANPSLEFAGSLKVWWGLRDIFIRAKKPCLKTMGIHLSWCQGYSLPCDCLSHMTSYQRVLTNRSHISYL